MTRFLVPLLVLLLFALNAPAQQEAASEVPNGSTWVSGSTVVTFNVSQRAADVTVSVSNASGTGSAVAGSQGPNSNPTTPTCDGSGELSTPDGKTVRVNPTTGKPEYRNGSGGWSRMRPVKRTKRGGGGGRITGDDVTGLPDPG